MKMILKILSLAIVIVFLATLYIANEYYQYKVAGKVLFNLFTGVMPEYINSIHSNHVSEQFVKDVTFNNPVFSGKITVGYAIKKSGDDISITLISGPKFINGKTIFIYYRKNDGMWKCNKGTLVTTFSIAPCRDHDQVPEMYMQGFDQRNQSPLM